MTYVKEGHGSVFRRVALSALIDTADRASKKEPNIQTTRVIRYDNNKNTRLYCIFGVVGICIILM